MKSLSFQLKIVFATLLSLCLVACKTSVPAPMLPLTDFGILQQSELITLHAGEREIAFTARVENDSKIMHVVAITPTGQRLFSFERTDASLHAEAGPLWPTQIPLTAVWADIEMMHALPKAHLQANWRVETVGVETQWFYKNTLQARVKLEAGKIILIKPQYTLTLERLPE
jgi:hypothetical protein